MPISGVEMFLGLKGRAYSYFYLYYYFMGAGGGGGWEVGGRLNPPLGLFGLAIGPRSASHRPKHA